MPHGRKQTAFAALFGALLLSTPALAETLRIGAASSLRDVVVELAPRFEGAHAGARVVVSYGASSVLAAQFRAGAPLDLLLLADAQLARELSEAFVLDAPTPFAHNRLVIVARDADVVIETPAALRSDAIRRIAIPSPAVPVGRYAREWLTRRNLLDVLASRAVQTEHARATLLAVDNGHVDVAIVYETDARIARNAVVAYRIPDAEQPAITYVALRGSATQPLAEAWLDFLRTPATRKAFEGAGFETRSARETP